MRTKITPEQQRGSPASADTLPDSRNKGFIAGERDALMGEAFMMRNSSDNGPKGMRRAIQR